MCPDDIDVLQKNRDLENEAHVKAAVSRASTIPTGEPGACRECSVWSPRLVRKRCAPCRDEMGLA